MVVHDRHHDPWTPELRAALVTYIDMTRRALHLGDWQIDIRFDADEDDAAATDLVDGRRCATIRFPADGDGFLDATPEDQRETVVHELLHCLHGEITWMCESDLAEVLADDTHRLWMLSFRRAMELTVDRLAGLLAPHLPAPDLPSPSRGPRP